MAIRIAVDAMGGDDAPAVVLDGAVSAARDASDQLEILLFGPAEPLRAGLAERDAGSLPIRVVEAPEVVEMGEAPVAAVRAKPQSSIRLGLSAVQAGEADAFVSAGNTGAVMAASLFVLGRLPGVARPSLLGYFPTTKSLCVVLDVGSNVDCKPEHLVQFAQMGSVYARLILKVEDPVVGLLNIGEEPGKGNEQAKAAFDLLEQAPGINFFGNVEGRDVMHHGADVVICDGFVGNVMLKFGESVPGVLKQMIGTEIQRQRLDPEAQQRVGQVLGAVRQRFNPDEYGGAPLLGVAGNVRIGHGSSTPRAIERMIEMAAASVEHHLQHALVEAVAA